jgi:hypothetical protein
VTELRCFCSHKTLLAKVGRDKRSGEPWVHVKVHKQGRIYGEVIVTSPGTIRICCRDCLRWHTVHVKSQTIASVVEPLPDYLAV